MRDILLYSVLRIVLFGALWGLLIVAGFHYLIAGIVAAVVALLASVLFLRTPRAGAAESWRAADEARREKRAGIAEDPDAQDEDALLDAEDEASEHKPDQKQD